MKKIEYLDLLGLETFKNFIATIFCTKEELKKFVGTGKDIFYNEIVTPEEPTEQKIGDYWMQEY